MFVHCLWESMGVSTKTLWGCELLDKGLGDWSASGSQKVGPLWAFLGVVPWKITFFVLVFEWCLTQSLTILINTHVIWKSVGASNTLSVVNVGLSTELRKSQCFIFLFTFYFVIACVCISIPKLLLDICFFMILIVLICLDDTNM